MRFMLTHKFISPSSSSSFNWIMISHLISSNSHFISNSICESNDASVQVLSLVFVVVKTSEWEKEMEFETLLLYLLDVIGFGLNIGFAYLIFTSEYLRKPIFIFMACFSVCDIIFCLTSFFLATAIWPLGDLGCKIFSILYEFAADIKPILMILVTFIFSFQSDVKSSTMKIIIGTSLLQGLVQIIPSLAADAQQDPHSISACMVTESLHFLYQMRLLVKFILPCVASGAIVVIFSIGNLRSMIKQLEVTRMFAITLIIYVILSTPLVIFTYSTVVLDHGHHPITPIVNSVLQISESFGPIYKPIFFYFRCHEIRNELSGLSMISFRHKRFRREQIDCEDSWNVL